MRDCSLDLRLSPVDAPAPSCRMESMATNPSSNTSSKEIVVLYDGRLCVHSVEELQIRAIIEMGKRRREVTALEVPLVGLGSPLGFRVKRSLQRFLQKRKMRRRSQSLLSPNSSSSSSPNF